MMESSARGRIILVRHGRSGHVHTGRIDVEGYRLWIAAYDAAELAPGEAPTSELRRMAAVAGAIVTSDTPRAHATARLLDPGRDPILSPLLRETALPVPDWRGPRLPVTFWLMMTGIGWSRGRLPSVEPKEAARERAHRAVAWLIELADERGDVIAVTHGSFRRLLLRALVAAGWSRAAGRSHRNWSAWVMTREAGEISPASPRGSTTSSA